MKVKELLAILEECDPDDEVVLAADAEGNSYGSVADWYTAAYAAGEVGFRELTDELREDGYGEADVVDGEPCVVLVPLGGWTPELSKRIG